MEPLQTQDDEVLIWPLVVPVCITPVAMMVGSVLVGVYPSFGTQNGVYSHIYTNGIRIAE